MFNQADPTKEGPIYSGARTPDTVALTELLSHWLDLSSEDLDTVSMVDEVGYINVDQPGYPFIPTTKWGDAMRSIASLSGSIFYIDPDRRLVYTDVDTQNSSLVFSDTPAEDQALPEFNGYTVIGYRR